MEGDSNMGIITRHNHRGHCQEPSLWKVEMVRECVMLMIFMIAASV